MQNWPGIEILTGKAQKRGGRKVSRAAKAAFLVQVTARTRMPCGTELKASDRVVHEEADNRKRTLRSSVQTQGEMHLARCRKCNP